jgi:1,2-diacylglycerol 3-beta-galactosyltransferase
VLRRTVTRPVYGGVARAVTACGPALIVAFHPITADPAARARDLARPLPPVITVVTDLVTAHRAWRDAAADQVIVPSPEIATRYAGDEAGPGRYVPLGLPVAAEFCQPPLSAPERARLKRELGLSGDFLVVLTGGAEGSGGLRRRAAAIARQVDDVDVVVICGRNRALRRRVSRLAGRAGGGRVTAQGFVANMADWLRCADIVVGKAGPGTIAEAACCGAPLVLTSFVPGQERGNAQFVTGAGAGLYAPRPRQLAAEIGRLRRDPRALAAMRADRGVAALTSVNCPMSHCATSGSMSHGTSQQVPAGATRLSGYPTSRPSTTQVARPPHPLRDDRPSRRWQRPRGPWPRPARLPRVRPR